MLSLFLALFFACPFAPPVSTVSTPLVELSTQRGALGDAHWATQVVVDRDGRFTAGGRSGRLSAAALAELEAALSAIPSADAEGLRPTCRARPFAHVRLTTPRGVFIESTPCGRRFHRTVADVVAILDRLSAPAELVRVEAASEAGGAWRVVVRVDADGHFLGPAGEGTLDPRDLATLRKALAATRLTLAPPSEVLCAALPAERHKVSAGEAAVTWSEPCSREPDPTVHALTALLAELTATR